LRNIPRETGEFSEYVGWHIDDLGVVFWQGDFFSLSHSVQSDCEARITHTGVRDGPFLGIKRLEREVDHPFASSAKVRNVFMYFHSLKPLHVPVFHKREKFLTFIL
jgi:hypothetical protein